MRSPQPDYSLISEVDWARLAAYIDGEGSVQINTQDERRKTLVGTRRLYLRVMVSNTDPRLLLWLKSKFGGCMSFSSRSPRNEPRYKRIGKWLVACRQAEAVLLACLPYLIVKKDQAEVALAFQETITPPGSKRGQSSRAPRVTPEVDRFRYECRERLVQLRHEHIALTDERCAHLANSTVQ